MQWDLRLHVRAPIHTRPFSIFHMNWDHEPVDCAVASWTAAVLWRFWLARLHRQRARRLAHSKTWRELTRFMESPLSLLRMHWDHEPERANVGQASRLPSERESASRNAIGFTDGGQAGRPPYPAVHGEQR